MSWFFLLKGKLDHLSYRKDEYSYKILDKLRNPSHGRKGLDLVRIGYFASNVESLARFAWGLIAVSFRHIEVLD